MPTCVMYFWQLLQHPSASYDRKHVEVTGTCLINEDILWLVHMAQLSSDDLLVLFDFHIMNKKVGSTIKHYSYNEMTIK